MSMLSSLPVLTPRDSHLLWYTPVSTFSLATSSKPRPASSVPSSNLPLHLQQPPHLQHSPRQSPTFLSPLAQLAADEATVAERKLRIQRFGATWIKPLGCSKTLQGDLDEALEREQAALMNDGASFPGDEDLDAIPPDEEEDEEEVNLDDEIPDGMGFELDGEERAAEMESYVEDREEEPEQDLDADIPEGNSQAGWGADSEDEDEEEEEGSEEEEAEGAEMESLQGSERLPSMASSPDADGSQEESPQQAIFSHDEAWDSERVRGMHWRAAARYQRRIDEDSMEVDSDE